MECWAWQACSTSGDANCEVVTKMWMKPCVNPVSCLSQETLDRRRGEVGGRAVKAMIGQQPVEAAAQSDGLGSAACFAQSRWNSASSAVIDSRSLTKQSEGSSRRA